MKMNKTFSVCMIVSLVFIVSDCYACGPFFDEAYLLRKTEKSFFAIPEGCFHYELQRLSEKKMQNNNKWKQKKRTVDAELEDLKEALDSLQLSKSEKEQALKFYSALREAIAEFLDKKYIKSGQVFRNYEKINPEETIYFNSDFLIPDYIPAEFAMYLKGAITYHNDNFKQAITIWEQILTMPVNERKYKTTWVSFMIGKAYLNLREQGKAISYFEKTRNYAKEGYRDSLELSLSSYGWQALAELESGDFVPSIHHYFEVMDSVSLGWVCCKVFALEEEMFKEVIKDSLARRIILSWLITGPRYDKHTEFTNKFLQAVEDLNDKNLVINNASRFALKFYNMGKIEEAKKWLSISDQQAPLSMWISSKLLLREGKINESIEKLRQIIPCFEKNEEWANICNFPNEYILKKVHSEMGVLFLKRQDYILAFDALVKGEYWEDMAYVAEKVLTSKELEDYLNLHAKDKTIHQSYKSRMSRYPMCENFSRYEALKYVLARRLIREELNERPLNYLPTKWTTWNNWQEQEINPKQIYKKFLNHIKLTQDIELSNRKRAEHYFEAGRIARKYGMELMGTELDPDWFYSSGAYIAGNTLGHRFGIYKKGTNDNHYEEWYAKFYEKRREKMKEGKEILVGTKDEETRVLNSLPEHNKRFHYRYYAAELMWKCARLLPDNDNLLAQALYEGGVSIN